MAMENGQVDDKPAEISGHAAAVFYAHVALLDVHLAPPCSGIWLLTRALQVALLTLSRVMGIVNPRTMAIAHVSDRSPFTSAYRQQTAFDTRLTL